METTKEKLHKEMVAKEKGWQEKENTLKDKMAEISSNP